ncbi:hypothetical protein [Actinomyces naeslundii]|uniref:hypothetical protein n=1 Tax=Actinomyces naeslundii TaxID=1655 RepID=UPI00096C711B|nr:hypothetical protein [Actinomyces naeslundii]OMG10468.1 hypothetical protein BKH07_06360 [Actinomyces naeslundii]
MSAVDDMQAWITDRFPDAVVRTIHRDDHEAVIIGTVVLVVAGERYAIGRVGREITPFHRLDSTHAATFELIRCALADTSVPVGARLRRLVNADATEDSDGYRVTAGGEHVAAIHFRAPDLPTTTIGDDVEDHGYMSSALLTVAERVAAA